MKKVEFLGLAVILAVCFLPFSYAQTIEISAVDVETSLSSITALGDALTGCISIIGDVTSKIMGVCGLCMGNILAVTCSPNFQELEANILPCLLNMVNGSIQGLVLGILSLVPTTAVSAICYLPCFWCGCTELVVLTQLVIAASIMFCGGIAGCCLTAGTMNIQFQEELAHAEKMFQFVCETGGKVNLMAIEAPCNEYNSVLEIFEETLKHEQEVTSRINNLMDLAQEEKNHMAQIFLQWFITEQIEEEAGVGHIITKLKRIKGDGRGLMMIDQELEKRTFVPIA